MNIKATASALQVIGALTNCHEFLRLTNLIGDTLEDAWTIEGLSRNHVKKAVTPQIYGSSATTPALWMSNNLKFTKEDVNLMQHELLNGRFSSAVKLKDFIIENVQPQAEMLVNIAGRKFTVKCNRFKWEVMETKNYLVYSSESNTTRIISREVALIPDTDQFKRYFATCMIHGLDSIVADDLCKHIDFCIPVHDAFNIHPNDIESTKQLYIERLFAIYKNRHAIRSKFFKSIGITKDFEDIDTEELTEFSINALK